MSWRVCRSALRGSRAGRPAPPRPCGRRWPSAPRDRLPPVVGADLVLAGRADGVPDLVVVLDGVLDLVVGRRSSAGALAELQHLRVEEPLLGLGVHLQERCSRVPDRGQRCGVARCDLVEVGERAPLVVVLAQDDLGDVHGGRPTPPGGRPEPEEEPGERRRTGPHRGLRPDRVLRGPGGRPDRGAGGRGRPDRLVAAADPGLPAGVRGRVDPPTAGSSSWARGAGDGERRYLPAPTSWRRRGAPRR